MERHAQLPIYTTFRFRLTNVEKFLSSGATFPAYKSITVSLVLQNLLVIKEEVPGGKNQGCKIYSPHNKKFSPFAIEDILDIRLGDDVVITLEPVVPLLPNVSSVVTSLQ